MPSLAMVLMVSSSAGPEISLPVGIELAQSALHLAILWVVLAIILEKLAMFGALCSSARSLLAFALWVPCSRHREPSAR